MTMQFRCLTCGHLFHDGPPPLEALSDQQAGLVHGGRTEVDDVRLALVGTTFEGMGAANFCDDCLLAVLDNPRAFRPGAAEDHNLDQNLEAVYCSCGVTYDTTDMTSRTVFARRDWVLINRLRMRHTSDTC